MMTMTTFAICLFIIVMAIVMLVPLLRDKPLRARCKLPGVDFTIDTRDGKD